MKIGSHDTDDRVLIIAEIGNNHEGDFDLAKRLIALAAETGVDAVKFQTFVPAHYSTVLDAARQARLEKFRLSFDQFRALAEVAAEHQVMFLSTPFDMFSADFLVDLCPAVKVSSSDNTFYPMLELIGRRAKAAIMSTGLAEDDGIAKSLEILQAAGMTAADIGLLHCVVAYPTPEAEANVSAVARLKRRFPACTVGYSDHTLGVDIAPLAVAAGARIIEKHFTLDKHYSDFRDHELSANPGEMVQLVKAIRRAEKVMGTGREMISPSERAVETAVRRSIVPVRDLPAGHVIAAADITWVRPGGGLAPGNEAAVIGKVLAKPLASGAQIRLDDLKDA